jgi:hypothetical protein
VTKLIALQLVTKEGMKWFALVQGGSVVCGRQKAGRTPLLRDRESLARLPDGLPWLAWAVLPRSILQQRQARLRVPPPAPRWPNTPLPGQEGWRAKLDDCRLD